MLALLVATRFLWPPDRKVRRMPMLLGFLLVTLVHRPQRADRPLP